MGLGESLAHCQRCMVCMYDLCHDEGRDGRVCGVCMTTPCQDVPGNDACVGHCMGNTRVAFVQISGLS